MTRARRSENAFDEPWMGEVRVGQMLKAKMLWNASSGRNRQLPHPVAVESVIHSEGCQSGVLFGVRTNSGEFIELDAAWFEQP